MPESCADGVLMGTQIVFGVLASLVLLIAGFLGGSLSSTIWYWLTRFGFFNVRDRPPSQPALVWFLFFLFSVGGVTLSVLAYSQLEVMASLTGAGAGFFGDRARPSLWHTVARRLRLPRTESEPAESPLFVSILFFLCVAAAVGIRAADSFQAIVEAKQLRATEALARQTAEGLHLVGQAQEEFQTHPELGLLLAVEGIRTVLGQGRGVPPTLEQSLRNMLSAPLGYPLPSNGVPIAALSISPNGKWLVSGGTDGSLLLRKLTSSSTVGGSQTLAGHEAGIQNVMFSPDSRWLVSTDKQGVVQLWDLGMPDVKATQLRSNGNTVQIVAFDSHSRWLAIATSGSVVHLWKVEPSDPAAASLEMRGHSGRVTSLDFSPDGHLLATGSEDQTVRVWILTAQDPGTDSVVLEGQKGPVAHVEFSPDGQWLVAMDKANQGIIRKVSRLDDPEVLLAPGGSEGLIKAVAFSADSKWLATGDWDGLVLLWDIESMETLREPIVVGRVSPWVGSIAFGSSGKWLSVVDFSGNVWLWPIGETGLLASKELARDHKYGVASVSLSPDGHWLATLGLNNDSSVGLWDLTGKLGQPVALFRTEGSIGKIVFSSDSKWLVAWGDGTPRIWPLGLSRFGSDSIEATGKSESAGFTFSTDDRWLAIANYDLTTQLVDLEGPTAPTLVVPGISVAFSPDSRWLVTLGPEGWLGLFRILDGALFELPGHQTVLTSITFSTNGQTMVTTNKEFMAIHGLANVGNTPTSHGFEVKVSSLMLSPDGKWLGTVEEDSTVRVWDVASAVIPQPRVLQGPNKQKIISMQISPDNKTLAVLQENGTVRVWDMASSNPVERVLPAGTDQDRALHLPFSPDGNRLAIVLANSTIRLWDLAIPTVVPMSMVVDEYAKAFKPMPKIELTWEPVPSRNLTGVPNDSPDSEPAPPPDVQLQFSPNRQSLLAVPSNDPRGSELAPTTDYQVHFSPDGRWLLSEKRVDGWLAATPLLWNLSVGGTLAPPVILSGREQFVGRMEFSVDSRWLAQIGPTFFDQSSGLWHLPASAKSPEEAPRFNSDKVSGVLGMSPDSKWLLTYGWDGVMQKWDLTAADPFAGSVELKGNRSNKVSNENLSAEVGIAKLYPGGQCFIISGAPSLCEGSKALQVLQGISPQARWLATKENASTVRIWPLTIEDLASWACLKAGRDMTMEEWKRFLPDRVYSSTCGT